MSEQSKATPGPWSVGCPNGKRHYIMKSGYVVIAELPHVQGDSAMVIEAYKEREANAALIAASPTMAEYVIKMAFSGDNNAKIIAESFGWKAS